MQTPRHKSTADYATAEVRRLILSGELQPGARVDQVELAERLEVSRHPVRQAIERLAERGFIDLYPHRSAVVAEISVEDMDELYHARIELEILAIRDGWDRRDGALRKQLADLAARMRAAGQRDLDAYMAANRAFHLALYQSCGNRYLLRTIASLFDLSERYQRTALLHASRVSRSKDDHKAMLQALESGDLDGLVALVRAHNAGTQETVRAHLAARAKPSALVAPRRKASSIA